MDLNQEEETTQPFIAICIGNEEFQTYAFIDSRADGNTISYELYTKLQVEQLTQTHAVFQAYTGHHIAFGRLCIPHKQTESSQK